jgi:hypothetical protein
VTEPMGDPEPGNRFDNFFLRGKRYGVSVSVPTLPFPPPPAPPRREANRWWRILAITAAALAIYAGFRRLPVGTNLSHMDFRVSGGQAIEFCDPANPQFIPVVEVRSPVVLSIVPRSPVEAGRPVELTARLTTASGKPLAPPDLLYSHTRKLHIMAVDPGLGDYHHVHPEPGTRPGEWDFSFVPASAGTYRLFADFTPVATQRGLYASADLAVSGTPVTSPLTVKEESDLNFGLRVSPEPFRAGVAADLKFTVSRVDGGTVEMQLVMDAYAHLVAFDLERMGFAHLHPVDAVLDPHAPALAFRLTVPRPGDYVVWSQVNVAGRDRFHPFRVTVVP